MGVIFVWVITISGGVNFANRNHSKYMYIHTSMIIDGFIVHSLLDFAMCSIPVSSDVMCQALRSCSSQFRCDVSGITVVFLSVQM